MCPAHPDISPAKSKRARLEDDESISGYAPSTAPTFAITNALTLADTNTPLTESSVTGSKSKPRPKRYACTWSGCSKVFDRPIRLQTHYNTHTGERPHACPHEGCEKAFFKSSHLKAHIQEKHNQDRDHVCDFMVRRENGESMKCGRAFPTSSKLKRHIAQHEEKEETTCSWDGCGKVFRKQETLQRHIKKDHLDESCYLCDHEAEDGGGCGQSFPTAGLLKTHIAQAHETPKYVCEICSSHGNPLQAVATEMSNDLDDAFLPSPGDAANPDGQHSLKMETNMDAGSSTLHDPGSNVVFATFAELQLHNRIAHPPTCTQCGKHCKSNKDLKAHIDIYHAPPSSGTNQPQREFLCEVVGCPRGQAGNGFTRKGNMDVHIKNVHSKEKAFMCGGHNLDGNEKVFGWNGVGCQLALGTKQALIAHIRTQHLGLDAATGVRTGLHKSAESKKGRPKKERASNVTALDVSEKPPDAQVKPALALLTGAGYDQLRPIPCLFAGSHQCQMRFAREFDLANHLEMTHGWQVDDIEEALKGGALSLALCGNDAFVPATGLAGRDHDMNDAHLDGYQLALDPQLSMDLT